MHKDTHIYLCSLYIYADIILCYTVLVEVITVEKKSQYKGFTPAQARAHKKYMENFVELRARVSPERRDEIQSHASACGESVNAFINRAIQETMDRDKQEAGR